jgi:DNA processing protein
MGYEPRRLSELAEALRLTAGELSSMLLILELQGRVISQAGGRYVRSKT